MSTTTSARVILARLALLAGLAFGTSLMPGFGAVRAATHADIAYNYAPIHFQDTDSSDEVSDYITAFDFDGDWVANNNWDNRGNGQWPATVYYSVVESCTHYFVIYAYYHPRDWTDTPFDQEHENDLEGVVVSVRKDGTDFGTLEGMITVSHTDFYSFTPPGSPYTKGHEDIDGLVAMLFYDGSNRPLTSQEAKGHGVKAFPYAGDFNGHPDQDGVIYYPTRGTAEWPSSGNDRFVPYRLKEMMSGASSLWAQALIDGNNPPEQSYTYSSWGTFRGNSSGGCGSGLKTCKSNAANAPWGWDDGDDGGSYRGEFALDPAHLFEHYFNGTGNFSQSYIHNPYLLSMYNFGYTQSNRPRGFPSQLNLDTLYGKMVNSCN